MPGGDGSGPHIERASGHRPDREFHHGRDGLLQSRRHQYLFFAERPVFSIALVSGGRREILSIDKLYAGASYDDGLKGDLPYCDCQVLIDRTYFLPLGDRSWPDDTLVEYEYMDGDNDPRVTEKAPASG